MKLKLDWMTLIVVDVALLSLFGSLVFILTKVLIQHFVFQQMPTNFQMPTDFFSWLVFICADILALSFLLSILYTQYCQVHTLIDDEKITQPSLFGKTEGYWNELKDARYFLNKYTNDPYSISLLFRVGEKKIEINLLYFSNKDEIFSFIAKQSQMNLAR